MLRTFFVPEPPGAGPDQFHAVIARLVELYGARLLHVEIRGARELAGENASPGDARGARGQPGRSVLVGDYLSVVCDKGHEADVIVVWHGWVSGGAGHSRSEQLGELVRQAPRPIWVWREPLRIPEHVLVAYDGSAHSGRALHVAANLSEAVGARLTVLNVDESRDGAAQDRTLARAAGYCGAYSITVERVGLFGNAAESIEAYAVTSGCDLLVVGAAGVGYLKGLLFGSVAAQVLTRAACSVLVAK